MDNNSSPKKGQNTENDTMRLAKTMAHRGFCSRREADELILKGWVYVNGKVIKEKGFPVTEADEIVINERAKKLLENKITIIINKPVGFVSAQPEKGYQAAVSLITEKNHWQNDKVNLKFHRQHLVGLAPAGRLDIDSKGLLVLTADGKIAKQLIGSDGQIEKEYLVRVTGEMQENGLSLLTYGLSLDGEKLRPAKVSWLNEDQLRFLLHQGKKRQIRRMCAAVGLKVVSLKRVRIGAVFAEQFA